MPNAPRLAIPDLPAMLPIVKDCASRKSEYLAPGAAVPLARLFSTRTGHVRFRDRNALSEGFRLAAGMPVVVTGVGYDEGLERYWEQGRASGVAREIAGLRVSLATTPNFSLFTDVPRYENLYNMKRIAICWEELQRNGVPTALHLNGRTEHDWKRWTDFVVRHPEISAVAFEFTSGAKGRRSRWYVRRLLALAAASERKMKLVVRGGTTHLHDLAPAFDQVIVLSMKPYVATMRRQRLEWHVGGPLTWRSDPTPGGASLDRLFSYNVSVARQMVEYRLRG